MSEAVAHPGEETKKGGVGDFIEKTRAELDKTSFPSASDVQSTTIIVIVSVIFFAAYLYVVDRIWAYVIEGLGWLISKLAGI